MSFNVTIYAGDDPYSIAKKIFNFFDVGAICSIEGIEINGEMESVEAKGKLVMDYLRQLDEAYNCDKNGKRRKKFLQNSVGGPVAQKIFCWELTFPDKQPRYKIWRAQ